MPCVQRGFVLALLVFLLPVNFVSEEDHHICHFATCLLGWCVGVCIGELPCCWDKLGASDLKLFFGEQVGSL